MINIIIYQHNILTKITDEHNVMLPHTADVAKFKQHLIPVHVSSQHYVATIAHETVLDEHLGTLQFLSIRQALNHFDHELIKQIVYYHQLNDYYTTHSYCGRCGALTVPRKTNKFVFCNVCNTENYPHIAPCIIVRIHKGSKILMARGINFPPKAWGLIAGFIEIGESLEEGVRREVKEEIGIEIDNIKYWGSQPWAYPNNSLMIGFTATHKSGEVIPDKVEIEAAGFYGADEIPGLPSTNYSIASRMINEFLNQP